MYQNLYENTHKVTVTTSTMVSFIWNHLFSYTPATYDLTLKFAQNPLKFTIHGIFMCWS